MSRVGCPACLRIPTGQTEPVPDGRTAEIAGRMKEAPNVHFGASKVRSEASFLLELDGRALLFQFLLELVGVGLLERFLHNLGSAFHQVLGFLQAQAGRGADDLDDLDLLLAGGLEHDVEGGLLFGLLDWSSRGRATATAATADGWFNLVFFL